MKRPIEEVDALIPPSPKRLKEPTEPSSVKLTSKMMLALYLVVLLWLVLFKTSTDFSSVLEAHIRGLNLIPLVGYSSGGWKEMLENLIVFIPLGLLFGMNFKRSSLGRKLAFIAGVSLAVEMIQFVLAIGVTDITDIIMNTMGGAVGLALYSMGNKHGDSPKRDRFIVALLSMLLVLVALLRFLVFRVRY